MYIDNPLELDWDQGELVDVVSAHDKTYVVTSGIIDNRIYYELEGVGLYSCGELVEVRDIEVTDAESIERW